MWQARMAVVLLAIAIAGCGREGEDPARTPPVDPAVATTAVKPEAPELEDVIERDPRYVIGISYPPIARQYPGLARLLEAYARDARAELMVAVSGLGKIGRAPVCTPVTNAQHV